MHTNKHGTNSLQHDIMFIKNDTVFNFSFYCSEKYHGEVLLEEVLSMAKSVEFIKEKH
jgi:hypothetical protein